MIWLSLDDGVWMNDSWSLRTGTIHPCKPFQEDLWMDRWMVADLMESKLALRIEMDGWWRILWDQSRL